MLVILINRRCKELNLILQPYFCWPGHYKKYSESLKGDDDVLIRTALKTDNTSGTKFYILRVLCMFLCLSKSLKYIKDAKNIKLLINETEPFSLAVFFPLLFLFKKVVLTVHSISKSSNGNGLFRYVIFIQRWLLGKYLFLATKRNNFSIVVHSSYHKAELISRWKIPQQSVHIIDYPCPLPKKIPLCGDEVLVFGAVRSDKEMISFFKSLSEFGDQGVVINVVGKITDIEVKEFAKNAPAFINFVDEFVSDEELEKYIRSSRYFIVPYGPNYSGGAGPIKDAASFGRPVLALKHPLFEEINTQGHYCQLFSSISEFYENLKCTDDNKYSLITKAALNYAYENNWSNLRGRYLNVASNG